MGYTSINSQYINEFLKIYYKEKKKIVNMEAKWDEHEKYPEH